MRPVKIIASQGVNMFFVHFRFQHHLLPRRNRTGRPLDWKDYKKLKAEPDDKIGNGYTGVVTSYRQSDWLSNSGHKTKRATRSRYGNSVGYVCRGKITVAAACDQPLRQIRLAFFPLARFLPKRFCCFKQGAPS